MAVTAAAICAAVALVVWPLIGQSGLPPADSNLSAIPPRPVFDSGSATDVVARLRDECFDVAENLVRTFPNDPNSLCLLGTVHNLFANDAEAQRLWECCLSLDPRFADVHLVLGQWRMSKGELAAAESHFEQALRLDPVWDDVCLPFAEALLKQGKSREAIKVLQPFVRRNPRSTEGWCRLGKAWQDTQDFESAQRCYREAIAVDDECAEAWYGASVSHQRLGETHAANEALDRFRELQSKQDRARRLERMDYTDENRLRVPLVNTHMTAGRVYALHGRWNEAEWHWKRAALLEPRHRESRESLAEMYVAQQRTDDAVPMLKELCDLEPNDSRRWLSFGILCYRSGQPADAETAFRRVMELAPQSSAGYAALAQVQVLPGRDLKEAIELARRAVELSPSAPNHFVLADALWRAGDVAGSRAELEKALQLDPNEPRYREAYARMVPIP